MQHYLISPCPFLSYDEVLDFLCIEKGGNMAFATPYIEDGILNYCVGIQWYTLSIESRDWQIWLNEKREHFRYEGQYTACLEERESKQYWYAYRNYHNKVYKIYLGRSERLTPAHLQAAAIELNKRCIAERGKKASISTDDLAGVLQSRNQESASQLYEGHMLNTDARQKGEYAYMDVGTATPLSAAIPDTNSLLFAPLEEPLTKRELEILHCLIEGLSNKEIAQQLVLSIGTIKWHLKKVYSKLHVHTRSQAIVCAKALKL
jgi:DNA-binding CsgD family transcriptional regulator